MTNLIDLQNPVGHGILDVPLVAPSKDKKIPPRGFALVGMTNSGRVKTLPYGIIMDTNYIPEIW